MHLAKTHNLFSAAPSFPSDRLPAHKLFPMEMFSKLTLPNLYCLNVLTPILIKQQKKRSTLVAIWNELSAL